MWHRRPTTISSGSHEHHTIRFVTMSSFFVLEINIVENSLLYLYEHESLMLVVTTFYTRTLAFVIKIDDLRELHHPCPLNLWAISSQVSESV